MATLLLSSLGNAIGGPIGGSFGALLGQHLDRSIIGGGGREGPRLRELAVSSSSYGQPIARVFGTMRLPGSIIWASDLVESAQNSGGKGQPSTTTYSYAASFAVALSSTPIEGIGRIWADGKLLRGEQGDLKAEGQLRFYSGTGDEGVDPLIEADAGLQACAYRQCAYVVFEGLQLAQFGNRIPALSFEVIADNGDQDALQMSALVPGLAPSQAPLAIKAVKGFAHEGGALGAMLGDFEALFALNCTLGADGVHIGITSGSQANRSDPPAAPKTLPLALLSDNDDPQRAFGQSRSAQEAKSPLALRYYDVSRDYQPSVQRANGRRHSGGERAINLPASLSADDAKSLINESRQRSLWTAESRSWRVAELDPELSVGDIVRLPEGDGLWQVKAWQWDDAGFELTLERAFLPAHGHQSAKTAGDAGQHLALADLQASPTQLLAFELPLESPVDPPSAPLFVAASSGTSAWQGAGLFAQQQGAFIPIGAAKRERAIIGTLEEPLEPSNGLLIERAASLTVSLAAHDLNLSDASIEGLANGANRLMVGGEILQFLHAQNMGAGIWTLSGLLRGRGGTEPTAQLGHLAGVPIALIDQALTAIDPEHLMPARPHTIAGMGHADSAMVMANVLNRGIASRPLSPVHPRIKKAADGSLSASWTRRARGAWLWESAADVPLVEDREAYTVGYGAPQAPFQSWVLDEPRFFLSAEMRNTLIVQFGPADLWVQQQGTHSASACLPLTQLG